MFANSVAGSASGNMRTQDDVPLFGPEMPLRGDHNTMRELYENRYKLLRDDNQMLRENLRREQQVIFKWRGTEAVWKKDGKQSCCCQVGVSVEFSASNQWNRLERILLGLCGKSVLSWLAESKRCVCVHGVYESRVIPTLVCTRNNTLEFTNALLHNTRVVSASYIHAGTCCVYQCVCLRSQNVLHVNTLIDDHSHANVHTIQANEAKNSAEIRVETELREAKMRIDSELQDLKTLRITNRCISYSGTAIISSMSVLMCKHALS